MNYDPISESDCAGEVGGTDHSCCAYPPENDSCENAHELLIDEEPQYGDNSLSADENFGNEPSCFANDSAGAGDVWFSFVGEGFKVDIETFAGSNSDTQIAVYENCGEEALDCDEDSGSGFMSRIFGFCAASGVTYYIEVEGWGDTEGTFEIQVSSSTEGPDIICGDPNACNYTPMLSACFEFNYDYACEYCYEENDLCQNAIEIPTNGVLMDGDNSDATSTQDSPGTDSGAPEVWYSFIGTGYGVDIEIIDGTIDDAQMAIYDSCQGQLLEYSYDNFGSTLTAISGFCTEIGQEYIVEVQGWNGNVGTFQISVSESIAESTCYGSCSDPIIWDQVDGTSEEMTFYDEVWINSLSPYMLISSGSEEKIHVEGAESCDSGLGCFEECGELVHGASGLMKVSPLNGVYPFTITISDCSSDCNLSYCNDPQACNFDPSDMGTQPDESICSYNCCQDPEASNYLDSCFASDECSYELIYYGDYDQDSSYTVIDFAGLLAQYGEGYCQNLTGDFNQDNYIDVEDLTLFLQVFGTSY